MLRVLSFLLFLPMAALAQTTPAPPAYPAPLSDTVSDYADLLPPEAEARVAAALQAARDETGVHIALATITDKARYGGPARFADFATGWFNAWGIGDAARNDGILILVSQSDREMRIALGDAYDVIWDGRAQRVIDVAMLPAFRNDDYAKGLEDGAMMAIDQIARPFAAKEPIADENAWRWAEAAFKVVAFGGFGLIVIWAILKDRIRDAVTGFRRCPDCGARSLKITREVVAQPGRTTDGQAVRRETCGHCGNQRSAYSTLPSELKQQRIRGRSKSGFSGGRSGGGGASGKW